jgi:hypothetical protein
MMEGIAGFGSELRTVMIGVTCRNAHSTASSQRTEKGILAAGLAAPKVE